MGVVVGGVILDKSVVLASDSPLHESPSLQPVADSLLRKLRHSKIPTGISYDLGLSDDKVSLLKRLATLYSFDCFILNASSVDDAKNEIMLAWGDTGGGILYVVSDKKKEFFPKLSNYSWLIVVLRSLGQESADVTEGSSSCENSSMIFINKLEELPSTVCHINRKATGNSVVTVGYVMKPSREEDFAKRGAFPLYPTQNGLIFMPLTFELPLSPQLQEFDIVLHKATDEIISIELKSCTNFSHRIVYTSGMQDLQRYLEDHPDCCVIDSFNNIYPVLDRLEIQEILLRLEDLKTEGRSTIRGPHFLKVDSFKEPDLLQRLSEAKLSLPSIVKPQVACGVANAHNMAIIFRNEDFKDLSVPLPAVVQEYVDHSSTLYKFYVLGEKVFYAVKKSTPNADILMKLSESNGLKPLVFDSLKSLPTAKEDQHYGDGNCSKATNSCVDLDLVTDAANWLRGVLDLTIFGFDVVIQEGTCDHVIVDVNYLPSFKEVPDDIAIPAFWEAIKKKFELKRSK
ncbi:inositol 1,3,4-trisphosphate 5/6-kinase 4-like isoform X2 [Quercus robur]|uniref:inositol 1,3,4-trisphosphate 5/6-kinase 4-like isoform X2 n=1 Tax=Quercus robur TaxID=38942 RepID=UPI0021636204|nr:inositol 1,3,4-trisphosphate 5/6-kinase 4-like isoform X2 [Quercus robur]